VLIAVVLGFVRELRTHKSVGIKGTVTGWSVIWLAGAVMAIFFWVAFYTMVGLRIARLEEGAAFISEVKTPSLFRALQYVWALWGNILAGFLIARRNHEHRTLAVLCFAATVPLVTFTFRSTGWPAEIVITGLAQLFILLGGGLLFKRTRSDGAS
jgi:hypothetical protein